MIACRAIIVMGVAGSGKTTVGRYLADHFQGVFLDSDDLCPAPAKAKMAAGIPLEDADRWPWIEKLLAEVNMLMETTPPIFLAWSGLKRRHREAMKAGLRGPAEWIFLAGPQEVIYPRLAARTDHFMRESMLASQFDALEPPVRDEDVRVIDVARPLTEVLADATRDFG